MLPEFSQILSKLEIPRRWVIGLLAVQLGAVIFEGIGIGMVLPILEDLSSRNTEETVSAPSQISQSLDVILGFVGLERSLLLLMALCFSAILMRQVFFYIREISFGYVEFEILRRLRNKSFRLFVNAKVSYHDKVEGGAFINELTTELSNVNTCVRSAVAFIGYIMLFVAYSAIAFTLSPSLTGIATAVFLLTSIGAITYFRHMRELGKRIVEANQDMLGFLFQRLHNIRLVQLSKFEDLEITALETRTEQQRYHEMARRRAFALLSVVIEPTVLLFAFVLLYVAVTGFSTQISEVLLFFFIMIRLVPVLKILIQSRQTYLAVLASPERLKGRISTLINNQTLRGGDQELRSLNSAVVFDNVSFNYGNADELEGTDKPALSHISLTIPAGETTAIVGPSGSGKSTLIDIVSSLREPTEGRILFDSIPSKEISVASIRGAVSYAPQQPQIFNVTVSEHIRYGSRNATDEEVRRAASLANASEFINRLPKGYDSKLGDNGSALSGGQRQRLDLARALVGRAPILLLDEPTANLDAESEKLFRDALDNIRRDTDITIIIVGHRLSTIASADQIVVLRNGTIEAVDRHEALLQKSDWYSRAINAQHVAGSMESSSV